MHGKRGGGSGRLTIEALAAGGGEPGHAPVNADAVAVHELLDQLERMDPEAARVVELKFFAGMTDQEAAAESGIPLPKLRRHWTFARSWFLAKLSAEAKSH